MLFNILALISLLVILMMLRRFVGIFPSLLACLIRWKESINLESSVQLSRDRDFLSVSMVIPFSLLVWRFGLYRPVFLNGCNETIGTYATIGIFLFFILIRKGLEYLMMPKKGNSKIYKTACKASRTFFSLLTIMLITMGCIMTAAGASPEIIKSAMLWVSASIYLIFILRKTQILISNNSFFTAFLYLCALEMIPTGAIIASAIIF